MLLPEHMDVWTGIVRLCDLLGSQSEGRLDTSRTAQVLLENFAADSAFSFVFKPCSCNLQYLIRRARRIYF